MIYSLLLIECNNCNNKYEAILEGFIQGTKNYKANCPVCKTEYIRYKYPNTAINNLAARTISSYSKNSVSLFEID